MSGRPIKRTLRGSADRPHPAPVGALGIVQCRAAASVCEAASSTNQATTRAVGSMSCGDRRLKIQGFGDGVECMSGIVTENFREEPVIEFSADRIVG